MPASRLSRTIRRKPVQSDRALADVCMPIHAGICRLETVVHVNAVNILDADMSLQLLHHQPVAILAGKVISRCVQMACIEAYAQSLPGQSTVDTGHHVGQMLESIPQTAALAGGHLQQDTHIACRCSVKDLAERFDDSLDADALTLAAV